MYGPRNLPAGTVLDHTRFPVSTVVTYRFLSERAALEAALPPGFELAGEPVVSIDIAYITQIPWLAGRGYNLADIKEGACVRCGWVCLQGRVQLWRTYLEFFGRMAHGPGASRQGAAHLDAPAPAGPRAG
jgi:hypothetical protein